MSGIEKFLKTIPGKNNDIKDMDTNIDQSGDFATLTGVDAVIRNVATMFSIPRNTYIDDPTLGCDLYRFIFEPADDITKEDIYMELDTAMRKLSLNSNITYDISFLKDGKGFIINLTVEYKGETRSITIPINENILSTMG